MDNIKSKEQEIEADLKNTEFQIDEDKLNEFLEERKLEQNFPGAILGGTIAAIIGAILWALITAATKVQIGWMAIGIGFLVGFSVRFLGKGVDEKFGYIGAIFSLLGCVIGNLLSVIIFASIKFSESFFSLLFSLDLTTIIEITIGTFSVMDLIFYGIAIYEGYKFSFRSLNENEVSHLSKETTSQRGFGSAAIDESEENSDMVELDYSKPIGLEFVKMQLELEELLNKKVDCFQAEES